VEGLSFQTPLNQSTNKHDPTMTQSYSIDFLGAPAFASSLIEQLKQMDTSMEAAQDKGEMTGFTRIHVVTGLDRDTLQSNAETCAEKMGLRIQRVEPMG
jgi:hypothetical protein